MTTIYLEEDHQDPEHLKNPHKETLLKKNLLQADRSGTLYAWSLDRQGFPFIRSSFTEDKSVRQHPGCVMVIHPPESNLSPQIIVPYTPLNFTIIEILLHPQSEDYLLVRGTHQLAILHLPLRQKKTHLNNYSPFQGGQRISCNVSIIGAQFHQVEQLKSMNKIIHVLWHPYSLFHLVVLTSDNILRIYNVKKSPFFPEQNISVASTTPSPLIPPSFLNIDPSSLSEQVPFQSENVLFFSFGQLPSGENVKKYPKRRWSDNELELITHIEALFSNKTLNISQLLSSDLSTLCSKLPDCHLTIAQKKNAVHRHLLNTQSVRGPKVMDPTHLSRENVWNALTLYFITTSGLIYAICPLIPFGSTLLPKSLFMFAQKYISSEISLLEQIEEETIKQNRISALYSNKDPIAFEPPSQFSPLRRERQQRAYLHTQPTHRASSITAQHSLTPQLRSEHPSSFLTGDSSSKGLMTPTLQVNRSISVSSTSSTRSRKFSAFDLGSLKSPKPSFIDSAVSENRLKYSETSRPLENSTPTNLSVKKNNPPSTSLIVVKTRLSQLRLIKAYFADIGLDEPFSTQDFLTCTKPKQKEHILCIQGPIPVFQYPLEQLQKQEPNTHPANMYLNQLVTNPFEFYTPTTQYYPNIKSFESITAIDDSLLSIIHNHRGKDNLVIVYLTGAFEPKFETDVDNQNVWNSTQSLGALSRWYHGPTETLHSRRNSLSKDSIRLLDTLLSCLYQQPFGSLISSLDCTTQLDTDMKNDVSSIIHSQFVEDTCFIHYNSKLVSVRIPWLNQVSFLKNLFLHTPLLVDCIPQLFGTLDTFSFTNSLVDISSWRLLWRLYPQFPCFLPPGFLLDSTIHILMMKEEESFSYSFIEPKCIFNSNPTGSNQIKTIAGFVPSVASLIQESSSGAPHSPVKKHWFTVKSSPSNHSKSIHSVAGFDLLTPSKQTPSFQNPSSHFETLASFSLMSLEVIQPNLSNIKSITRPTSPIEEPNPLENDDIPPFSVLVSGILEELEASYPGLPQISTTKQTPSQELLFYTKLIQVHKKTTVKLLYQLYWQSTCRLELFPKIYQQQIERFEEVIQKVNQVKETEEKLHKKRQIIIQNQQNLEQRASDLLVRIQSFCTNNQTSEAEKRYHAQLQTLQKRLESRMKDLEEIKPQLEERLNS